LTTSKMLIWFAPSPQESETKSAGKRRESKGGKGSSGTCKTVRT